MAGNESSYGLTSQVVRVGLTLGAMYGLHTLTKQYWEGTTPTATLPSTGNEQLVEELKQCQVGATAFLRVVNCSWLLTHTDSLSIAKDCSVTDSMSDGTSDRSSQRISQHK